MFYYPFYLARLFITVVLNPILIWLAYMALFGNETLTYTDLIYNET